MRDSRSKLEHNGRDSGVHSLAPEVRAARMLLSPSSQEEISQLAEDMELTLRGNQPTRATHSRRGCVRRPQSRRHRAESLGALVLARRWRPIVWRTPGIDGSASTAAGRRDAALAGRVE